MAKVRFLNLFENRIDEKLLKIKGFQIYIFTV